MANHIPVGKSTHGINLKINLGSVLNSESKICSKSFPERSNSTRFGYFSKEGTLDSELYPRLRIFTSSGMSNPSIELKDIFQNSKNFLSREKDSRTASSIRPVIPLSPGFVQT